MTLMHMPHDKRPKSAKPKLHERRFRVQMKCPECEHEQAVFTSMADEPGDPATVNDFVESGGLDRIEEDCERCGEELTIVVQIDYLRTPEEAYADLRAA